MKALGQFMQHLRTRFRVPEQSDLRMLWTLWGIALAVAVLSIVLFATQAQALPLSPGDRIVITVQAGEEFSGKYQVDLQGAIQLPYAGPVQLAGLEPEIARRAIASKLVEKDLFRPDFVKVSVQVLEWAPLEISVEGAVYAPGQVRINDGEPLNRHYESREEIPGGKLPERRLSDALKGAGGIRPTADIRHVRLIRGNSEQTLNLYGFFNGQPVDDIPLIAGDHVVVPALDQPQTDLYRPSRITPPGIKVYVSNLSTPSTNNANSTVPSSGVSLSYGARLSQGIVAGNCSGGTRSTNAGRKAILVRTDRLTGTTQKWETSVEALLRGEDGVENPILAEGDAISCYDSNVVNVRDIFRSITDVLIPLSLLGLIP